MKIDFRAACRFPLDKTMKIVYNTNTESPRKNMNFCKDKIKGALCIMRVKDAVAACLTEASGQYLSGETLAQKLGVSRNAVWKAVRLLQDEGFPIEAKKKTGYRLAQGVDLLTEESVRPYLHSRILGHPLYVYSELGSTNNTCKTLVRDHARHGTVVAANCQTAGKGRRGRTWESPADQNIYMSLLLRPEIAPVKAPMLTLVMAYAAAMALRNVRVWMYRLSGPMIWLSTGKKSAES